MKKQPSAGAAADADLSYVQRAFLPGLTGSSTDRWLKATPHLFLSLNGEENGRDQSAALLWLLCSCQVGAEGRRDWSFDWQVLRTSACQGPSRHHGGFVVLSDTLAVLPNNVYTDLISEAYR